jgi:hypothetical protein
VDTALARQPYIICHDTLPYGRSWHAAPAVCRGFYNRYDTTALLLARRLWGIIAVPPPEQTDTGRPATTTNPAAASTRGRTTGSTPRRPAC